MSPTSFLCQLGGLLVDWGIQIGWAINLTDSFLVWDVIMLGCLGTTKASLWTMIWSQIYVGDSINLHLPPASVFSSYYRARKADCHSLIYPFLLFSYFDFLSVESLLSKALEAWPWKLSAVFSRPTLCFGIQLFYADAFFRGITFPNAPLQSVLKLEVFTNVTLTSTNQIGPHLNILYSLLKIIKPGRQYDDRHHDFLLFNSE